MNNCDGNMQASLVQNALLTLDMRMVQLSLFLVLVTTSSSIGKYVNQQELRFIKNAVDADGFDGVEGIFDGEENSAVQDARIRLLREDKSDRQVKPKEIEGYTKFNGRSLDQSNYYDGSNRKNLHVLEDMVSSSYSSRNKDNMVEKSLDDGSHSWVNKGGWNLPSVDTVQGWASNAYSKLPSVQTVASYVPEAFQQYLPNQQTIESYIPPIETIRTSLQAPLDYFKRKIFGGYNPQKLLTRAETDRLVQALSDKLLNKEGGENIQGLLNEVAQNVAHRAEDNMTPIVIRLVVDKVVHAMAVSYIGPFGAFLARKHIDSLADNIAERAITQYQNAGPYRIDLYSYLKQINWRAVFGNVVKIINNTINKEAQ